MTVTGQSAYFVPISVIVEASVMQLATCQLDAGAREDLISKDFRPTDWLLRISDEVQPPSSPASK